jgi:hypothetical protein
LVECLALQGGALGQHVDDDERIVVCRGRLLGK